MAGPEDDNEFKKVQLVLVCEFYPHLFLISTGMLWPFCHHSVFQNNHFLSSHWIIAQFGQQHDLSMT